MRLFIVRVLPNRKPCDYKKVEFIRIPLRLGNDVFRNGKIGDEKKKLFLKAMQAFRLIMDIHGVDHYMACATSAMREAKNGANIADAVRRKFDLKIDIISGDQESNFILQSVLETVELTGNFMNIDVGGGSTEITFISNGQAGLSRSFPIGAVRLMEGNVKQTAWDELEDWLRENAPNLKRLKALGTGGNISKLYRMSGSQQSGSFMHRNDLERLYQRICASTVEDRINRLRLNPDRADVIEYAAQIYLQIMRWSGVEEIISPAAGLKEGLIIEMANGLKLGRK